MTEQEWTDIEEFLSEEYTTNEPGRTRENIRLQLAQTAFDAIEQYRQEYKEKLPVAEDKLNTIVLPWWNFFSMSREYDRIQTALARKTYMSLNASEQIPYYWPHEAIREYNAATAYQWKPFETTAEIIDISSQKGFAIDELVQQAEKRLTQETWNAYFQLQVGGGSYGRLYIARWPNGRAGFGFAMARDQYYIVIDRPDQESILQETNPNIIIGFSNQIEAGKVDGIIQQSLEKSLQSRF